MKVYLDHSNITQNMHGARRNYRYVWDVSVAAQASFFIETQSLIRDAPTWNKQIKWTISSHPRSFCELRRGVDKRCTHSDSRRVREQIVLLCISRVLQVATRMLCYLLGEGAPELCRC